MGPMLKNGTIHSITEGSLGSGWRDRTSLQTLCLRTERIQGASEERTA